jgi:hypothetical protein
MRLGLTNTISARGTPVGGDGLSLDLQFAADKTLTARKGPTPVFTRGSTGTFVGSNGLVQSAAVNAARFDHDSAGVCRGLLIEESRTNSILQSENFASASWNAGTATRTSDQIAAPDGASTADLITSIAGNFGGKLAQTLSFAATTYTASVFVKKGNWRYIGITLADISNSGRVAAFDFDTETASANGVPSATIGFQKLSSGWYRIFLTLPTTATTGTFDIWMTTSTGAVIGPIGSGQTVYTWGAQVEAGSFPTSYIPTTTAPLARSADVCDITGGNFTSFYNQSEGTFLSSTQLFSIGNDYSARYWNVSDPPNYMRVSVYGQTSTQESSYLQNNDGTLNSTVASEQSRISRTAGAYQLNNARIVKNGTLGVLDTTFTPYSSFNNLGIMTSASGTIASLRYYRKRLPDAKLQALTV